MKTNFKNTAIFNYQYLDKLVDYLNNEIVDQESKIALLRRLLTALVATEHGEHHESFKTLKKNLTEHKAIEHIIELLIKKENPDLQLVPFDYSKGIFEVLRTHKDIIKPAAVAILQQELSLFVTTDAPIIEYLKTQDVFEHYTTLLNNLLDIRNDILANRPFGIQQLEPLATQSCEHAIKHLCMLCDELQQAFYNQTFTEPQFALRVAYMIDLHYDMLANAWGGLRVSFLRIQARQHAIDLMETKNPGHLDATAHEHSDSCSCPK